MPGGNPHYDEKGRFTGGPSAGTVSRGDGNLVTDDDQLRAIDRYTGAGYVEINGALRNAAKVGEISKVDGDEPYFDEELTKDVKALDAAIANNVIGRQVLYNPSALGSGTLFRGTKVSVFGVERVEDLKVGMELQNHGFISTSRSQEAALKFVSKYRNTVPNPKQQLVLLTITTGPNSHGIDVVRVKGINTIQGEEEVILSRKSKFKVVDISKTIKGGKLTRVVHVTHVDPH